MIISRLCACAALSLCFATGVSGQTAPTSGAHVFQRMHDAYAGKWYSTLRFVQKTTQYRDTSVMIATWYESLRQTPSGETQLRIDLGDPSLGDGVLYTADSTWRFRGGKQVAAAAGGNEFLPVIEGVYMQPVERTMAQLAGTGMDMSRVVEGTWQGRPMWVIGVSTLTDSTSAQLWVDQERNVATRMILSPAPNAPVLDIHLGDYVRVAGGWLATKVVMLRNGKPLQVEDYADWRANIELPAALFSRSEWIPARHWASR